MHIACYNLLIVEIRSQSNIGNNELGGKKKRNPGAYNGAGM